MPSGHKSQPRLGSQLEGPLLVVGAAAFAVAAAWHASSGGGEPPPLPPWKPIPALICDCDGANDGHPECACEEITQYIKSMEESRYAADELSAWIELEANNSIYMREPLDGVAEKGVERVLNRAVDIMEDRIKDELKKEVLAGYKGFSPGISKERGDEIVQQELHKLHLIAESAREHAHFPIIRERFLTGDRYEHLLINNSLDLQKLAHINRVGPVKGWRDVLNEK